MRTTNLGKGRSRSGRLPMRLADKRATLQLHSCRLSPVLFVSFLMSRTWSRALHGTPCLPHRRRLRTKLQALGAGGRCTWDAKTPARKGSMSLLRPMKQNTTTERNKNQPALMGHGKGLNGSSTREAKLVRQEAKITASRLCRPSQLCFTFGGCSRKSTPNG